MPVTSLYMIGATSGALLCVAALVGPGRRSSVRATFALASAVDAVTCLGYYLYFSGYTGTSLGGVPFRTLGLSGHAVYALGSALLIPTLLLFALAYRSRHALPWWTWAATLSVGAVRGALRATDPWLNLLTEFNMSRPLSTGKVLLLGRVDTALDYAVGAVALVLIIYAAWTSHVVGGRRQAIAVVVAASIWLGAELWTTQVRSVTLAPFPNLGIAANWLLYLTFAVGLFRYGLTDPLPTSLLSVLDRLSDGVVVLDGRGRVIAVNETAGASVPGLQPGVEALGVLPGIGAPQVWPEGDRDYETTLGDRTLWIRAIRLPTRSENPRGLVALMADVTERREAERRLAELNEELERRLVELENSRRVAEGQSVALAEANTLLIRYQENKDRFLANVSHELRTPLNSVIGFSTIMLGGMSGALSDEQRRQLSMIQEAGTHLLSVVNDLLDLSRLAAGRIRLDLSDVDAASIVRDVAASIVPQASEKGLSLVVRADEPVHFVSDALRFRQIVVNLTANAVNYTDVGGVEVSACADGGDVILEVRDSGPGIPPERLEGIFDRFERLPPPVGTHSGTGLGLSIARELARILGGDIEVDSVVGTGSAFRVRLPAAGPDGPEA
jgi:signal transduction histidine kinase